MAPSSVAELKSNGAMEEQQHAFKDLNGVRAWLCLFVLLLGVVVVNLVTGCQWHWPVTLPAWQCQPVPLVSVGKGLILFLNTVYYSTVQCRHYSEIELDLRALHGSGHDSGRLSHATYCTKSPNRAEFYAWLGILVQMGTMRQMP